MDDPIIPGEVLQALQTGQARRHPLDEDFHRSRAAKGSTAPIPRGTAAGRRIDLQGPLEADEGFLQVALGIFHLKPVIFSRSEGVEGANQQKKHQVTGENHGKSTLHLSHVQEACGNLS